jgi:hypothetical protein
MQGGGGTGSQKKRSGNRNKQGKGPANSRGRQGGQRARSPMRDSRVTSGSIQHGEKRATVEGRGGEWGKLPPKLRDEITNALNEAYPERYKSLLRLYYKNLAEEE